MINYHKVLKKLTLFFIFIFLLSSFLYITDIARAQESDYVANEFLVKYKKGINPQTLENIVAMRAVKKRTLFGRVGILFENMSYSLRKQKLPEDILATVQTLEKRLGVVEKEKITDDVTGITYLVKTDGTKNLLLVIEEYKKIEGVEYVEPNYLYEPLYIQGN